MDDVRIYENGTYRIERRLVQKLQMKGLYYADVLPPSDTKLGKLPYTYKEKLLFPLCAACCDEQAEECTHTDTQRVLSDVWWSDELQRALHYDYKLIRVHEVYQWTNFTPINPETSLFAGYIR